MRPRGTTLLAALLFMATMVAGEAGARGKRVGQIPNGGMDGCNTCHTSGAGTARNAFGLEIETGFLGETVDSPRFLVVENGCRFFQELRFPDLIHAGLRCGRIGTSSFTLELALFRGTSEEAAATGFFAQVQVDAQSHRPSPLDAPRRALLEAIG